MYLRNEGKKIVNEKIKIITKMKYHNCFNSFAICVFTWTVVLTIYKLRLTVLCETKRNGSLGNGSLGNGSLRNGRFAKWYFAVVK